MYIMIYIMVHNSRTQEQSVDDTYSIIKPNIMSYNNNHIIIKYDSNRDVNKISQIWIKM